MHPDAPATQNDNARLEAFSDAVFAIAMTLLVLDIKLPASSGPDSVAGVWTALGRIVPAILTFVLSFVVILITWVNHHAFLKLVGRSSASFMYANGFLLITVVILPFPTAMMGEHVLTEHAAPSVVLYNAVVAVQGLAWVLLSGTALKNRLTKSEHATRQMRINRNSGYGAFAVYSLLALLAVWIPLIIAIVTALTWIFWLVYGIRVKHE